MTAAIFPTLVEMLRRRAADDRPAGYTFLVDGESQETTVSFSDLDLRARAIAARLTALGAAGKRVLILYPPGLDYVAGFFGCLYAGAIAVPAYPPDPTRLARTLPRLQAIVRDAEAQFALTTSQILSFGPMLFSQAADLAALTWLATDDASAGGDPDAWHAPAIDSGSLAFLQYTSGSTGDPKGVMLTHGNLLANSHMISRAFGMRETDVVAGWLPLYHDMGLIGTLLQPLYIGVPCVLMSSLAFLARPLRWLKAISKYRATTSGGPNFAYDLCVRKTTAEDRAALDLSSWNVAFTGAEPVRAETLERFAEAFAPCGFKRSAFYPCYGLAEATLLVTGGEREALPIVGHVNGTELEQHRVVEERDGRSLVGCGRSVMDERVVVVDPDTRTPVSSDRVGEIWVSGPNVAQGYWNKSELSAETFQARTTDGAGPFLRTGDLGFMRGGELFVTGRVKDLIIIRGRNHYPQDIELTVERSHPAIRPGCSASFSIDVDGEERLVVAAELDPKQQPSLDDIVARIRQTLAEEHEIQVHSVALVKAGGVPKTSSGKIQRRACKAAFLEERLEVARVWRHLVEVTPSSEPETAEAPTAATPFELEVATFVALRLGIPRDRVDLSQPITRYGLDSLAAVELADGLERAFGNPIEMQALLGGATLRDVARELARAPSQPRAPAVTEPNEHPLSYGQRALWVVHQLDPDSGAYNISTALRVHNELDTSALRRSFQRLVLRHAGLRTTFRARNSKPVAHVAVYKEVDYEIVDASAFSVDALHRRVIAESNRPFDLEKGPLFRVRLFQHPTGPVLLISVHHIVADMWSLVIVGYELGQLYREEIGGAPANLSTLSADYADHVRAEENMLVSPKGETRAAYWKDRLAGELPLLDLPLDRPRPGMQTFRGASRRIALPQPLVEKLKAVGKEHNATLYMTLLAAYYVLLHRHTNQTDIVVGSPTRGRSRPEQRDVLGYFVNMMPLRAQIEAKQPFGEFLDQVRRLALSGFASSDYPFFAMVDRVQPVRDPRHSPIFQTSFVFQKAQGEKERILTSLAMGEVGTRAEIGALTLEAIPLDRGIAQFDLTVAAGETDRGLAVVFEYNTDLFDDATIERLVGHYQRLLESIVADDKRPIGQLALLSEAELHQIVVEWNDTAREYPAHQRIEALIAAHAQSTPDATAVQTHGGASLTYAELDRRANQLAHRLQQCGVSEGSSVGVYIERSLDLVVAWLAAWKAGAAYVPIASDLGAARVSYMLRDANVAVLVTNMTLGGSFANEFSTVLVDRELDAIAAMPTEAPQLRVGSDGPAYVIYTSGSTGQPKGSINTHRGLGNLIAWQTRSFRLAPGTRVAQLVALSFDASVWETWPTLAAGGTLCLVDDEIRSDPRALVEWFTKERIHLACVPTPLAEPMLAIPWPVDSSLRTLLTGGDRLVRRPSAESPFELVNNYGPTECTVLCVSGPVTSRESARVPDLGRPIDNAQIYVLGPYDQVAPIGVTGEICIGGVCVGDGYLNRPELTAEKFTTNPFAAGRMYRTGDLGRWLPDGRIEFVGRVDHQVKIRGYRIELGEIEAALASYASNLETVVVAREDSPGEKRLVGYVVSRDARPESADLRAYLKTRLPEYMVPSSIIVLDDFPRTVSGKIERKRLPAPERGVGDDSAYVAPRTKTEGQLAEIWARVLRLERVSVDANFFELGGHSLLATQVVSHVRHDLGAELSLGRFFEAPTIGGQARILDELRRAPIATIPRVPREGDLELSYAQQRLWFIEQLEGQTSLYNVAGAIHLVGELDVTALTRALNAVVARHESLRTTFETRDERPHQVIAPSLVIELPVTKVRSADEALQLALAEARRPFDLTRGPLIRAELLRLGPVEHMLVFNLHHIVCDGWSLTVLMEDLAQAYRGEELPPLAIQYADFSAWQRSYLDGSVLEEQLAYWKKQLAGMSSLLELPTDRKRPSIMTYEGAVRSFQLPRSLVQSLEALGRESSATLFMTLLAGFQLLLQRYCRTDDVTVGSPVANRNRHEIEPLIGFFVNTLVLRTDLSGNPTFLDLLRRVREVTLGAYAHQDVPFERLVEEVQPHRNLSHTPLFQVLFVLQNTAGARALPGLQQTTIPLDAGISRFDLTLALDEASDGLRGSVTYNTALFDAPTIERLIGHYTALLEAIASNPAARLGELGMLTARERQQILVDWNNTALDVPTTSCLHELIEEQAERTPDGIAVELGDNRLTYRELDHKANQLARYLRALGVRAEMRVAICVERSVEMIVGLLGIMKAGGAYMPLDPTYPKERLAFMLDDASVSVMVTETRLVGVMPPHQARVVMLDEDWHQIAKESTERVASDATSKNLAYVIYSSGSTGRPKGIEIEHHSVCNLVVGFGHFGSLSAADRVLQFSSVAFDASVDEIFTTLAHGGTLLVRAEELPGPSELFHRPYTRDATVLNLTTAYWHTLVAALEHGEVTLPPSVRRVNIGGERALPELVRAWQRLAPAVVLFNVYGPTEATALSTVWQQRPDSVLASGHEVPIGRPLPNYTAYVLDPSLAPVAVGVPGELCIGGPGLARGYLNRPELTAEKFVPNPFGPGRLYRTGDLVCWLPDGDLEYLGRIDDQVKIRGFRIELGEIETAIAEHPVVSDVAVLAREDVPGDKRLVGYLVVRDPSFEVRDLRAHLKTKLPEFMVPPVFVVLDALPLTPNGKVDRKALPVPTGSTTPDHTYIAPRTPTEQLVAGIWMHLLRVDRVGIEDNFFELGGHSLLATQVASRVRQTFGVELPLKSLFESPTVALLARTIEGLHRTPAPPIQLVARDRELALSFAQQRLWFLDQLEPNSALYNISGAVELRGELDVPALLHSLNAIVERHEALRTTFTSRDGTPIQVISASVSLDVPVIDVASREEATNLALEEAREPFDLARGPLVRAKVLRLSPREHWLLLSMHHVVSDGWSLAVFMHEMSALYTGTALPPLEIQYADFAAWQREFLSGDSLEDQLVYWRKTFAGMPARLDLPTDRPRPPVQTFNGAQYPISIPAPLAAKLEALSRASSVTMFMTLLAAFQTLLHRYSGADDIAIGTPVANRNRTETEPLIGFFVNTLVMRTDLAGNPTFRELLARVRDVALGAYAHQDVPFEKLVEDVQPQRDLSHSPLFQVLFVLQNTPPAAVLPGIEQKIVDLDSGTAKFELTLNLEENAAGIVGSLEYNTDLFDASTIEQLASHFYALLDAFTADPNTRIATVPMLAEQERHRLVVEWNTTGRDYGAEACLHELFEQQADRTPDALAVVGRDRTLTYRQLDERANQLAHFLRSCGVAPGERVGIFLERTSEIVVAILGALKTGAAYVPLDPTYPADRLAFIQEDARPRVLITQRSLGGLLPDLGIRKYLVDADAATLEREPVTRLAPTATQRDLSHVIYTSGSTGRPKGVEIEHTVMVNYCRFSRELHPADELAAVLFATSVCFDMSLFELFLPLSTGGRVHVVDDVFGLASLPADTGLTYLNAVPSVLSAYLRVGALPATIRAVSCAGEPLSNALVHKLHELGVGRVYDFYGPTETFIATWTVRSGKGAATIGRPVANLQCYVVDPHMQLVPRGVRGELYVSGAGVARGYLQRPDLTEARFVSNPFGEGRLYRTGDIVRWLPDGTLEYLGRIDNQVKIRGFRIELGEVETALTEHPSVREVAVIAREDVPGDKRLVAYVVGRDASPDVRELREYLKAKLPEYMVPSAFVVLDALPQTPNGKIDRRALPAPGTSGGTDRAYVAPRSPTEELLVAIWRQVLSLDRIGVEDNFFELGGHSLLATQIASRVRQTFGVEIPLRSVFASPTIATLAKDIERLEHADVPAITPVPRDGALELSFAQQRLWFLDQLEPNSALYNVAGTVRLRGELDVAALVRSLNTIVARHEALRTTFALRDGRPVQVIAPSLVIEIPLQQIDTIERATELALAHGNQPFDLERGPLVRAELLQVAPQEHWLLLSMHHIVSDGWSISVLLEELGRLYAGEQLAPLAVQYADFSAWQRSYLSGEVLDEQLAYWKGHLQGMQELLDLPTDRPRPPVLTYRGNTFSFQLPAPLVRSLETIGRERSATLFMTLLAAFQTLLHRYSRQDDIAIGSPVANRNRAETEPLIGFFVNTLVLRTDLSGNPTFSDLLDRVREVALGAYAHQDVPFERLVEELQPQRNLSYSPLFQVMFVLQNTPQARTLPGLEQTLVELDSDTAKFELTLVMGETTDGLYGVFEYNTDLFDASTIERMAGHFQTLLEAVAANPTRRIAELPVLSDRERDQLLVEWNATARDYPLDGCVHDLLDAQVARTPDAVAVEHDGQRLTYRELDGRANQLAHHLRTLGVGPDVLVGVFAERTLEMIVGMIAVHKAGGAYVPLDPTYPESRLRFIQEDTQSPVILTQERLVPRLPAESPATVVRLDADWPTIARYPSTAPARDATATNLSHIIYTSGSTGRPKGVAIEHRSVVNFCYWAREVFTAEERDGVLFSTSICFDLSVFELFVTLAWGGRVILVENALSVPSLPPDVGVKLINSVPSVLATVLKTGTLPASVTTVNLAGEPLKDALVQQIFAIPTVQRVYDLYGPSETTTYSTFTARKAGLLPTIGKPLANTQVYVLDANRQLVPRGIAGELYIGGAGVAREYLGRPDLTADRFVESSFGDGRLYRTGDLVRWLPAGELEYLGRLDHQVKIRGFRIELGEIEVALGRYPDVRESIVTVREDSPGDKRLVAYVVPRASSFDVQALRAELLTKLPDYMVPSAFVVLDALPLTPNGKVDRKALPAPDQVAGVATAHVGPRTLTELAVTRIFEELLRVHPVGVTDSFFELGGHSLLAVQLFASIRARLGVSLPLTTLFQSPTVEALARVVQRGASQTSNVVVLRSGDDQPPLVCVHPIGGTVFCYHELAGLIRPGRACYAIQSRGLMPEEKPLANINEMARAYIAQIREVVGARPFHLLGWSFGGVVGLEVARLLEQDGLRPLSTTLLDSFAASVQVLPTDPRIVLALFARDLGLDMSPEELPASDRTAAIGAVAERARAMGLLPAEIGVEELARHVDVFEANLGSHASHRPPAFGGDVTLLRASSSLDGADSMHGFREIVSGSLDVKTVAGDHYTALKRPHVTQLAALLDEITAAGDRR